MFFWVGGGKSPPERLCAQASGLARIRRYPLWTLFIKGSTFAHKHIYTSTTTNIYSKSILVHSSV